MSKLPVCAELALLLLIALLVLAAAGFPIPLFRGLLALAIVLLLVGVLSRAVLLFRLPSSPAPAAQALGTTHAGEGDPATRQDHRPAFAGQRYRLLVLDVDGTLVGADQRISPRVRRAIAATKAAGIPVALCTGRSPAGARRFVAELDLPTPHIFFDGALVAALDPAADVYRCPADPAALGDLAAHCAAAGLPFELYTRDAHFVARPTPETDWHGRLQGVMPQIADLDHVLATGAVVKGELLSSAAAGREAIVALTPRFAGRLRLSWAKIPGYPDHDLVNVVHPEVSKGEALRRLAAHFGVPLSAVVAVGDGPNDVPLLGSAGLGIAMGDAPPAVKAAAAAVTAGIAEDGLALAVERFLLS